MGSGEVRWARGVLCVCLWPVETLGMFWEPCSQHLSCVKCPKVRAGLWGNICPAVLWGSSRCVSCPGWSWAGLEQPWRDRTVLCLQSVQSQLLCKTAQNRAQLRLQCQAELLLRDQRCHSPCCCPKLCCSSRALLLPLRGFPNPTAAAPARTWECCLRDRPKLRDAALGCLGAGV